MNGTFILGWFWFIVFGLAIQLNLSYRMNDEKRFSRTLRSRVGGKLLKLFDRKCAEQELREGEAIREAIRKFVDYDKEIGKKETPRNPFFDKP